MKSLKRFGKKRTIVALSLCAVFVVLAAILKNESVYQELDEANALVLFSIDVDGGSLSFPPKSIKQIYDYPECVQVPSNFEKWKLLSKVTAQMSPSGEYNIFCASCSRIDDENFLEMLNTNALRYVKELELINCSKLSDKSIDQIYRMTKLQSLDLSSTNCNDESVSKLSSLPSLKRLYLIKTQVTGECFNNHGWNALTAVNLDFCPISKDLFGYLAKLPRLEYVLTSYYEGIVEDLEELAARPNIKRIVINTYGLPEEEAERLAAQYAENSKILFGRDDYRRFDEKQQYMDAHTDDPWVKPGHRISVFSLAK